MSASAHVKNACEDIRNRNDENVLMEWAASSTAQEPMQRQAARPEEMGKWDTTGC